MATLCSERPGMIWADGYAIGNGHVGLVAYGGPAQMTFAMNAANLWFAPQPDAPELPGFWDDVRALARQGRWEEINDKVRAAADPELVAKWKGSFQPAGRLRFFPRLIDGARRYQRRLDLDRALTEVRFTCAGAHHVVQAVASAPPGVLAFRFQCDAPDGLAGRLVLTRPADPRFAPPRFQASGDLVGLDMAFTDGMQFAVRTDVHTDGEFHTNAQTSATAEEPGSATIALGTGCRDVLVRVAIVAQRDPAEPPGAQAEATLQSEPADFDALADRGAADHQRYYRSAGIELHDPAPDASGEEPELYPPSRFQELYDAQRYLLVCSSRPDSLPPNLQGMWNESVQPPWDCDWHININLQENLWLAPTGNLLGYEQPLFRLCDMLVPGARRTARNFFGMNGIAIPHAMMGHGEYISPYWVTWIGGAGWLAQHYWTTWCYTGDRDLLASRAYPFMKQCAAFYLDYLQEDDTGRLIVSPSTSPENHIPERGNAHFGVNATMDLAIIREVLTHLVEAGELLGQDDDLRRTWRDALERLAPYPLADDGRLREIEDWEFQLGHRHLSHLYPLFPGDEITLEDTPELARAAKLALTHHHHWGTFDTYSGWSYPWLACCYARLGEGDMALRFLDGLARAFLCEGYFSLHDEWQDLGYGFGCRRGKLMQIEAGLASAAAIQEILLQSHRARLRLLPALPSSWRDGSFHRFRAQGGFEVSAAWRDGSLTEATIVSHNGQPCCLRIGRPAPDATYHVVDAAGKQVACEVDAPTGEMRFETTVGQSLRVMPE